MRIVVPDQRNVPGTDGEILKNGARTVAGMRPSVTIGSEKTTRTSFPSASVAISPCGPELTIIKADCASALEPTRHRNPHTQQKAVRIMVKLVRKKRGRVTGGASAALDALDTTHWNFAVNSQLPISNFQ